MDEIGDDPNPLSTEDICQLGADHPPVAPCLNNVENVGIRLGWVVGVSGWSRQADSQWAYLWKANGVKLAINPFEKHFKAIAIGIFKELIGRTLFLNDTFIKK